MRKGFKFEETGTITSSVFKNLICPKCGFEVEIDHYGFESEEEYDALFPTKEELLGIEDENDEYDEDDRGETYDEVCGELSDD